MIAWYGLFLLTTAWLWNLPVITAPRPGLAASLALGGIWLFGLAFRRWQVVIAPWPLLLGGATALLGGVVLPYPYDLGCWLIVGASLALVYGRAQAALGGWAFGIGVAGLAYLLQALSWPLVSFVAARVHELPTLAAPLRFVAALLGAEAAAQGGRLVLPSFSVPLVVSPSLENLGFYWLGPFCAGSLALLLVSRPSSRSLAIFPLALLIWAVLRFVALVTLLEAVRGYELKLFWHPLSIALSFLPLPLLAATSWTPPRVGQVSVAWSPGGARQMAAALALPGLAAVLLVTGLTFREPGRPKAGRLLFDEAHSQWESTLRPLDTEWFEGLSGYNYYCLAQHLNRFYRVQAHASGPLDQKVLNGCDVLVLKTPTKPFSPEEVQAVVRFVERGGGLWLIGDHTNVFGTSAYLNPLARRLGIRYNYDSTHSLQTGDLSVFRPHPWWPHPIMASIPQMEFATSCTLAAVWTAEAVITGYSLKALAVNYGHRSFFADLNDPITRTSHVWGLFLQCAAVNRGRGRVVAFTDSTLFSNYLLFMPGISELALSTVEWLNRTNRWPWVRPLCLWTGLLVLGLTIGKRGLWREGRGFVGMVGLTLGGLLALSFWQAWSSRVLTLPSPHTSFRTVAFEQEHSGARIQHTPLPPGDDRDYFTFYVWTQRLNLVPRLHHTLEEALVGLSQAVVLINPTVPLDLEEQRQLSAYLQRGGKLLLLASAPPPKLKKGRANGPGRTPFQFPAAGPDWEAVERVCQQILAPYLMSVVALPPPAGERFLRPAAGGDRWPSVAPAEVRQGQPWLWLDGDPPRAVAASVRVGQGGIMVFSDSLLFTSERLGSVLSTATPVQRRIAALEFALLRETLDLPAGPAD